MSTRELLPSVMAKNSPSIAFVSDPLGTQAGYGGAERLVETAYHACQEITPHIPVYAPLINQAVMRDQTLLAHCHTSWLQQVPLVQEHIALGYPFLPWATEGFNVQQADIVVSFNHFCGKSVIVNPNATHICYCHSPARYLWDQHWTYTQHMNPVTAAALKVVAPFYRALDVTAAQRVDQFIANSTFTAKRIKRYWRRDAQVITPPVKTQRFFHKPAKTYWLAAGRLVAYKGFEFAIDLFNRLELPLFIIGDGPDAEKFKQKAGRTITFLGHVDDEAYADFLSEATGLVYPGVEDFGIVMAEAQAAGKPVVAPNMGGAQDIILHGKTGYLLNNFHLQNWIDAIRIVESKASSYNPDEIMAHAQQFDESQFIRSFQALIRQAIAPMPCPA